MVNCVDISYFLTGWIDVHLALCFISMEPKKKKKVDPRREQLARDRLKKKLRKLEKVPPELIPIEDFTTPTKCLDETRYSSFHCCP